LHPDQTICVLTRHVFYCWQVLELREQASMDGLPPRSAAARGFVRLLSETNCAFEEVFAIGAHMAVG